MDILLNLHSERSKKLLEYSLFKNELWEEFDYGNSGGNIAGYSYNYRLYVDNNDKIDLKLVKITSDNQVIVYSKSTNLKHIYKWLKDQKSSLGKPTYRDFDDSVLLLKKYFITDLKSFTKKVTYE